MTAKKKKDENKQFILIATIAVVVVFVVVFFTTLFVYRETHNDEPTTETTTAQTTETTTIAENTENVPTTQVPETTTEKITASTTEKATEKVTEAKKGTVVEYPSDTALWKLICVNRYNYVDSSVENDISLSYVAGSTERMDTRAAGAYDEMFAAAKADGYILTPCSGYRSYSTQERLYYEFVNEYIAQGYSESKAHDLTSKRRNPPGSSEHNLGICMDIICASSSANFQNTEEYNWLCENAHKYGFILRYPEDKVDVTGVKFEPWHWRYVGVENAETIKNSGLCLEEYLGIV